MAKTLPPGVVAIPGVETPFVLNAVPDVFDERDLEYRPRLEPLPRQIDNRDQDKDFFVLLQKGNSCTGHAIAGVINTILAKQTRREMDARRPKRRGASSPAADMVRVSPYMLYYLARRYDEFEGEADIGSSLRGAFKGWFNHGVCIEMDWPDLGFETDPDEPEMARKCRDFPLGAYYRINPYRLDDMQSAITELDAVAVSAAIHDGWVKPARLRNAAGQEMHVIRRSVKPKILGGHAFILVGYNDVGFLVQNSWGPRWGKGGFATLPYEDWLESAYDAWVARPGVPQTPFYKGRTKKFAGTNGALVLDRSPDLKRLSYHVINLGNDGMLSTSGKFNSSPTQIERIFTNMERWHEGWAEKKPDRKHQIVFYAHGGLVSEKSALDLAQSSVNWWLNNGIYPIYFAWQTGPGETIFSQLMDAVKGRLPSGGLGFDLEEQFDRLVEKISRKYFVWAWDQMKQNAWAASAELPLNAPVQWPPDRTPDSNVEHAMFRLPGASLVVSRLAQYLETHGAANVDLHLVGHSAGSIFHAALLQRLVDASLEVASMTFLAPGLRTDDFVRSVLPHIGKRKPVKKFSVFNLSDPLELSDECGQGGITIYHKSLLYLVSRGLEKPPRPGMFETPLLGLERSMREPYKPGADQTLQEVIQEAGGEVIYSRSQAPAHSRSLATAHGMFDNDPATMTSVLLRALDISRLDRVLAFQENMPLQDDSVLDSVAVAPPAAQEDEINFALEAATAPVTRTPAKRVEIGDIPVSGSPIVDVLDEYGWKPVEDS